MLAFGSGDCGQLAHGVDDDADMLVKRPRVVYSLRDKNVATIACGGLHNVCATSDGRVDVLHSAVTVVARARAAARACVEAVP